MDVWLHIGSEKTGTSTVQAWCQANRAALARHGLLYPQVFGKLNHMALTCYVARVEPVGDLRRSLAIQEQGAFESFRAGLPARLAEEVAASGAGRMLVSNEHLSSRLRSADEVQDVKRLLDAACGPGTRYTIVHYIRRQDDLLQSLYSMSVKAGSTRRFKLPQRTDDWRLNPLLTLDLWSSVFGQDNVTCRVFDRGRLAGGDIVTDLTGLLGLDTTAEPGAFAAVADQNRRLSPDAIEFLRQVNEIIPAFTDTGVNELRRGLPRLLEDLPEPLHPAIASPAELRALLDRFAPINAEVARRYLGRADGVLFDPPAADAERPVWQGLTTEAAVRIGAHIWLAGRQRAVAKPRQGGPKKPG